MERQRHLQVQWWLISNLLALSLRNPNYWLSEAGDVTTGIQQQSNAVSGETRTSAGLRAADFEVAGSTFGKSQLLVMKAGDITYVSAGVQQQANALSRGSMQWHVQCPDSKTYAGLNGFRDPF